MNKGKEQSKGFLPQILKESVCFLGYVCIYFDNGSIRTFKIKVVNFNIRRKRVPLLDPAVDFQA